MLYWLGLGVMLNAAAAKLTTISVWFGVVIATLAESKPKSFGRDTPLVNEVLHVIFSLIENSDESAAGVVFDNNPASREDTSEHGE